MKRLLVVFLLFFGAVFAETPDNESPEQCVLPKYTGPCRAALRRYYFDAVTGECTSFFYGGCFSLGNCMKSMDDCERICQSSKQAFKESEAKGVNYACSLPKNNGDPCDGSIPTSSETMWYYDEAEASCKSFIYTGCGGNQNQFSTENECQELCDKAANQGKEEESKEAERAEEVDEKSTEEHKREEDVLPTEDVSDKESEVAEEVNQKNTEEHKRKADVGIKEDVSYKESEVAEEVSQKNAEELKRTDRKQKK